MFMQVLEVSRLLEKPKVNGDHVKSLLTERGLSDVHVKRVEERRGHTDFIKAVIPGTRADAPTLGVIGRLGGVGARPEMTGMVSDADGAVTALSVALKLADMNADGEKLAGDVIVATHICPEAPISPHEPVPFMGSPVEMAEMNQWEVDSRMDAVLSIDTTKGNRVAKWRGFAITPTAKEGWILKVSDSLLDIAEYTTGRTPRVLPITTQDITPYGTGLYHVNSIMQPATATESPVVGVAITSETIVPGCATGANQPVDIDEAARFTLEVAKAYGGGRCSFYDIKEWTIIQERWGSLKILQRKD